MTRAAQNLLLILVGGAVLWITLATDDYLNYVRPGFRYVLVPAALALVALGAAGLRREWSDEPTAEPDPHPGHGGHPGPHGHDHARGPRVAWLLCLPVLAIFVIAPPALGSFTAARGADRPPAPPPSRDSEGYAPLPRDRGPIPMTMGEFIGRAWQAQTGDPSTFEGVPVRLTGFVTPRRGGGWQVTRLRMACCAGDAVPFPVIVKGLPRPPADTWVQVEGTWRRQPPGAAKSGVHVLYGTSVKRIKRPANPYE
ncbi:TIGR03943 family protein [Actinomadura rubrobrunea]|uniref:TIGR03943 family protein n=1 Tax=Actinomadura rubrobrunea TaxID=115335 RepID=A0A9W6PV72_9ACTN|nr:TIGR03943 family protein [Actinomadura rubrobrunea]GLW63417.1 TIGR03943 family protein [Actinomadura rubrobrunea]